MTQGGDLRLALVEAGERPAIRWLHSEAPRASAAATLHRARRAAPRGGWQAVALLERGQYQLLQTEAPEMPAEEWRDALRWRLKDQLEFPVDGAAIDLLAMPPQAGPRNQRTLIVAAVQATVRQQWRRSGEDAGFDWQALDIAETALRNLSGLLATPGRGHALLHLGEGHATLVVTVAGSLLLSRQIEVARAQLASTDEYQRTQALERAGLELQRTLDGFDRVFSQVGLERLDVLPGAGTEAFADFARELVYVPVKVADVAAKLDLGRLPADTDLSEHWLAIGAALRRSEPAAEGAPTHLNLDPPTQRPSPPRWRASQGLLAAAAGLAAAWLLATGLEAWATKRQAQADMLVQALPAQRAQLEARDPGGADAIQRLAAERQRLQSLDADQRRLRSEIDDHLRHATGGYTPFFSALSRQSHAAVWITGFSVAGNSGAIEIQGRMTDAAQLPGYLQRLNQEAAFKGRQFARLQLAPAESLTEFTLGGQATDTGAGR
ncbi:MAG TPA: PilN domain-containing protein [Ideonella sp.]|nr:PilN domain-containing protein [Ideonella sp.]